jgi:hypothetical protein
MVTNVTPYCKIGDLDIASIVFNGGISPSGGGISVEEIQVPGRGYADVRNKGRKPKKYKIKARSLDREEIEAFLEAINTAPIDSEFYPFDAQRFGLIASAHAGLVSVEVVQNGINYYVAEAEITCREPWLYGPNEGIDLETTTAFPIVSDAITANAVGAPIGQIQVSGFYAQDVFSGDVSRGIGDAICYAVDSNHSTWYYVSQFYRFGTVPIARITCELAAYGLGTDGNIYVWDATEWDLFVAATGIVDISCAADGTIYAAKDGSLQKWNGTGWTKLGGGIYRVSGVGSSKAICAAVDSVWCWDNGVWTLLASVFASDISVSSDDKFVAVVGGVVYYWDAGTSALVQIGGANIENVSINSWGPNWDIVASTTLGKLYQYTTAGGWVELVLAPAYTENISVRITPGVSTAEYDRYILLCNKMLGDDLLEMNWRGEVEHSWEADLTKSWAAVALDVHSKTSGGAISSGVLTLDNGDYLMIPFYGPLPLSGEPGSACIELAVSGITGDASTCQVAMETDLSDMAEIDHDTLVVGKNTIYVPDLEGEGHIAIGIKAGAAGSISLTGIKGTVKRYVAPSEIPSADPNEDFKIRIEATSGLLKNARAEYNDRHYY